MNLLTDSQAQVLADNIKSAFTDLLPPDIEEMMGSDAYNDLVENYSSLGVAIIEQVDAAMLIVVNNASSLIDTTAPITVSDKEEIVLQGLGTLMIVCEITS